LAGLIGYYISPDYSSTGIERAFDDYLTGRVGMTSLDNTINRTLHRPPVGNDLYLTIDVRIQRIADKHFDDPVEIGEDKAVISNRGSMVVTDPHTGEILAMVSRPSYDPNKLVTSLAHGDNTYYDQLVKSPDQPLLERPIDARYVPGSTYKTVTLLAALDTNNTNLYDPFTQAEARTAVIGGQQFGPVGNNVDGYTVHFPVDTEYGFTHSANIIFARLGSRTGIDKWMEYNKRFYVGDQIPFDLPVAKSSVLKNGQPLALNELAADAFGQGYDFMTPMQMSLFDNAVANDGQLMRPQIMSKIMDQNKNVIKTFDPQSLSNPVSSKTAADTRQAMFGVIRCGSGSVVPSFFTGNTGIIGKTGTAQVSNGEIAPHAWLITQAPYAVTNPSQLPALTIVAMKENGGEGAFGVGPWIAHTYQDIFDQNLVKYQAPALPDPNYCCKTQLLQLGCR
jgi:cell division protein FtsI/penicillin-binding protein 2